MMSRRKSRLTSGPAAVFPLLDLPEDVLLHLLNLVAPLDRQMLRLTCHALRSLIDSTAIWKHRHVELVPKTSFNEQFWEVLSQRGLTSVALYPRAHTTPACLAAVLRRLLASCPRLHTLAVSANVAWYLASILRTDPHNVTALHVGALCYDRNSGELLANLVQLEQLRHLHLLCINLSSVSRLAACRPQLPALQTLTLETLMPPCSPQPQPDVYLGCFLAELPSLHSLTLSHKAPGLASFFVAPGGQRQPLQLPRCLTLDMTCRSHLNETLEPTYYRSLYSELSLSLQWLSCVRLQELRLHLPVSESIAELTTLWSNLRQSCNNLRSLSVAFTLCSSSSMQWVSQLPDTLSHLSLERCVASHQVTLLPAPSSQLGPSGHGVVSKLSPVLQQKLKQLELVNLALTPGGLMHIANNMPSLRLLRATCVTTISRQYVESFRKLLPACHLTLCSTKAW